ncbi:hypothetical protein [Microbispora sp. KK1-11]|uniref:hypothetical protein n=1 Tax=Microbispora sp. KK1-11 TaxID=2053005 RepID=UPI001156F92C|nr:hypothetical protein [Microbispora sp. KK1-11]TQS20985.1 hypothetical protein FLW16_40075 [Microbispora sp. KK1-11]
MAAKQERLQRANHPNAASVYQESGVLPDGAGEIGDNHTLKVAIKDMTGSPFDPLALIEETDWASLEHALGPAADTRAALADLLNGTPDAQARALDHLNDPVHHQNSLYTATAPAALYVAAILSDPRTDTAVPFGGEGRRYPLRQALLDWLGSVAREVDKEAEATLLRLGFSLEDYPGFTEVRAIRPALFQGVSSLLHGPDPAIREAALAAAVRLLDAPELTHHRAVLAPMVRDFLAASSNRVYRATAIDGLDAWGQETTSLVSPAEKTARRHRIGQAHAMHVVRSGPPVIVPG